MLKKKFINFRPLFYVFISLALGVIFSRYILLSNYVYLAIFLCLLVGVMTICFIKKRFKELVCVLVAFSCGFAFYIIEANYYCTNVKNDEVEIVARVSNASTENDNYQLVVLDSVMINGEKDKNILLINSIKNNKFQPGEIIKGSVKLQENSFFNENYFNSSNYRNNIAYKTYGNKSDFEVVGNNLHFNEKLQISVKEQLDKFMTDENSAISYAMLFGDKSEIDYETRQVFSDSGIAHILAVSGLHVGVLVAVLYFILRKIKLNKYIIPAVIGIILFFYCLLCGFSASVVRASIMAIVLILSNSFSKQYDSLSSIGLAGIIILIFKPFSIFDLGFQMSFASVIAIAIFYSSIFALLRKIKLPKIIASPLAMSISVQIGLFPLLINCFNKVSIISILLNIIVIPLFSVAFIILLIALPLSFLLQFFGNLLFFTQLILEAIKISAQFVASIPYSFISLFGLNFAFYLGYYSLAFVSSRFMLVSKNAKLIASLSIILITSICFGIIYII